MHEHGRIIQTPTMKIAVAITTTLFSSDVIVIDGAKCHSSKHAWFKKDIKEKLDRFTKDSHWDEANGYESKYPNEDINSATKEDNNDQSSGGWTMTNHHQKHLVHRSTPL